MFLHQGFAKESNGVLVLGKDSPNTKSDASHSMVNGMVKFGMAKTRLDTRACFRVEKA